MKQKELSGLIVCGEISLQMANRGECVKTAHFARQLDERDLELDGGGSFGSDRLGSSVDSLEELNGVVERCWCDAQLAANWVVEPEHEKQQQAEQDSDGARQHHVVPSVNQLGE